MILLRFFKCNREKLFISGMSNASTPAARRKDTVHVCSRHDNTNVTHAGGASV